MTITRGTVVTRSYEVWPHASVPYSMNRLHQPDGYRTDCSGYVSMCWNIPLDSPGSWGGLSTVTLVSRGWMKEIDPNHLRPGDAVGECGPGTEGANGHIVLFLRWLNDDDNDSRFYGREQAGGIKGWIERIFQWPSTWRAYRFRDIAEDGTSTGGTPPNSVPHAGETNSPRGFPEHGWRSRWLRQPLVGTDVQELQRRLNAHGARLLVDGYFGPATHGAVVEFQKMQGIGVDGIVGPETFGRLDSPVAALRRPWPHTIPTSHYFGLITGPEQSHGGFYLVERQYVKAIQQRLIALGYVPGVTDPNHGWADGVFGPLTKAAVERWQRARYAHLTTRYGEVWVDDWHRLFTY